MHDFEKLPGHKGPVLSGSNQMFDTEPACTTCPLAIWFRTTDTLNAFCREMRQLSWTDAINPILACDARDAALAIRADRGTVD